MLDVAVLFFSPFLICFSCLAFDFFLRRKKEKKKKHASSFNLVRTFSTTSERLFVNTNLHLFLCFGSILRWMNFLFSGCFGQPEGIALRAWSGRHFVSISSQTGRTIDPRENRNHTRAGGVRQIYNVYTCVCEYNATQVYSSAFCLSFVCY